MAPLDVDAEVAALRDATAAMQEAARGRDDPGWCFAHAHSGHVLRVRPASRVEKAVAAILAPVLRWCRCRGASRQRARQAPARRRSTARKKSSDPPGPSRAAPAGQHTTARQSRPAFPTGEALAKRVPTESMHECAGKQ